METAGSLSIRVNLGTGTVRNSPFMSTVVAAATKASRCVLSGTATVGTVVDVDSVIMLKARRFRLHPWHHVDSAWI